MYLNDFQLKIHYDKKYVINTNILSNPFELRQCTAIFNLVIRPIEHIFNKIGR